MTRLAGHGWSRAARRCALALTLPATLALPATAGAAPSFLDTVKVLPDQPVTCIPVCFPQLQADAAIDNDGNAIAAWVEPDGMTGRKLVFRYRPAGGDFGAPQTVPTTAGALGVPRVEMDGQGNATFVWSRINGVNNTVFETATRSSNGTVSPVTPIHTSTGVGSGFFTLVVNDAGDALFVLADPTVPVPLAATRPAGGSFGTPTPVATSSPGGSLGFPAVTALDSAGNALVTWAAANGPSTYYALAAYRPVGGSFPANADELDSSTSQYLINSAGFDQTGRATVLWSDGFAPSSSVELADKPKSSATFGDPLPVAGGGTFGAGIGVADDGRQIIAYARPAPGDISPTPVPRVETVTRAADGTLATPVPVDGTNGANLVTPVVNGDGKGMLFVAVSPFATQVRDLSLSGVGSATKTYDLALSPFATTAPGDVDDQGNGVIGYASFVTTGGGIACPPICIGGSGTESVKVAGFDNAGPRLGSLQTPTAGAAGTALPFAVTPMDVWSPIASTSWAFGDGGTSTDASTQHTYASGGDYTATVTSTDSVGNASTATRAVTIGGGPAGGGGGATPPPQTPQGPVTPGDAIKPVLSSLSMTRRTFAVAAGATPVTTAAKKKTPKGSAFRFSLSEVAKVQIVIEQKTVGRRAGSKCVKATKKNAKAKKCTLFVKTGTLTRSGKANGNNVPFTGRIGRKALKTGSYRATLVATDAAGNASSSRQVAFKITR